MPPEKVHFHEVGAIDSIVDIIGACIALEQLGKPRVLAASVVEGTGWVRCAHGRFPVPTMATLSILGERGIQVSQCDEPHELVTPTGAAILAQFAESFGPMDSLVATRIGYGLGTRENHTRPNVLRAVLGDSPTTSGTRSDFEADQVSVLECNLDDLSPEILGHALQRALEEGALDAFHTPIQMKKGRPGTLFTILCRPEDRQRFAAFILRETTGFGVRISTTDRVKLRRESGTIETSMGPVEVKHGYLGEELIRTTPEFESCARLAREKGLPLQQVYNAVTEAIGGKPN